MPTSLLKSNNLLGITMGDPAGIGPEVILKALPRFKRGKFLVIGSRYVLESTARDLGLSTKKIDILDVDNVPARGVKFGKASKICGRASYEYIARAVSLLEDGKIGGIVTSPISKEAISKAGYSFGGHTEILARLCGARDPVMMLVGGNLRVALVTRHIPLRDVAKALSAERIYKTINAANAALRRYFGIKSPRIGVCALNPHAGEGGALGGEERELILPAIKRARKIGINASGPHPADAIFYDAHRGEHDCVVCMYHDQGLAPLKMLYRDSGVNATLGLPFIRTSPDHGTAFDIAGRGVANPSSMIAAIKLALRMIKKGRPAFCP